MNKRLKIFTGIIVLLLVVSVSCSSGGSPGSSDSSSSQDRVQSVEQSQSGSAKDELRAEQRYVDFLAENVGSLGTIFSNLNSSLTYFDYSDEMIVHTAIEINAARNLFQQYYNYVDIPSKYSEVDKYYRKALWNYDRSLDYLVKGIDYYDVVAMERASDLMNEGTRYINLATEAMERTY